MLSWKSLQGSIKAYHTREKLLKHCYIARLWHLNLSNSSTTLHSGVGIHPGWNTNPLQGSRQTHSPYHHHALGSGRKPEELTQTLGEHEKLRH